MTGADALLPLNEVTRRAARRDVPRGEQRALQRERRTPLPADPGGSGDRQG